MIQKMKSKLIEHLTEDSTNVVLDPVSHTLSNGIICKAGVIQPTQARFLSVELTELEHVELGMSYRFSGVDINTIISDGEDAILLFVLGDNDLLSAFGYFAEDIINNLDKETDIRSLPTVIEQTVRRWQGLFQKMKSDKISREKQRGLFGELSILRSLLGVNPSIETLRSWSGPNGSNQDFQLRDVAIEVKTSMAVQPKIRVSNELQLDSSQLNKLFLALVHVDEIHRGADTLFALIEKIKHELTDIPGAVHHFNSALGRIGLDYNDIESYTDVGYMVRSISFYEVKGDFPRLCRENILDHAISRVSYEIAPNAIQAFRVADSEPKNHWK